jgi:hypothetical protein
MRVMLNRVMPSMHAMAVDVITFAVLMLVGATVATYQALAVITVPTGYKICINLDIHVKCEVLLRRLSR